MNNGIIIHDGNSGISGVEVGEGDAVGEGVGEGIGVGVGDGLGEGDGDGVGEGGIILEISTGSISG
jgi:hypothetical protein